MKIRAFLVTLLLLSSSVGLVNCASPPPLQSQNDSTAIDAEENTETNAEDTLIVWWSQGLSTSAANETIAQLVRKWEKTSGIKTTLQLRPNPIDDQVVTAIEQGNPPDVAGPVLLKSPELAWNGKLADLSDVVEPIKASLNPGMLEAAYYPNRTTGQRSFYAIPIGMTMYNLHYWQPYLDRLGLEASDIPQDWQGFWTFWQAARDRLHQLGEKEINSFCLSVSTNGADGEATFFVFLHGYNVEIFDDEGNLILDRPQNRQGLIKTISHLAQLYREGFIPSDAIDWQGFGNNRAFLDRQCLLVMNPSLSIPTTQRLPDTPYTQKEKNRYVNEIVTLSQWPNTMDGSPFTIIVSRQSVLVPANANNPEIAKQFLSFLFQPENLQQWNEKLEGRFIPVLPELLETSFWQNPDDPHLEAVRLLSARDTQPMPPSVNPAYGEIRGQKVFTKALRKVLQGEISPEEAADEAIARMKEIIDQYQQ
ncbi:MAG: ABC transporter substrate-binding protein [Spirulina sp.]